METKNINNKTKTDDIDLIVSIVHVKNICQKQNGGHYRICIGFFL